MAAKSKKKTEEEVVKKPTSKREPKSEAPSRNERAAALLSDINQKMRGRASLMAASEYRLPYLTKRLPTGLLTLDIALRGGVPSGGITQIIGRRSAGKSYLVWCIIRQLQEILGHKMKVLLAMTEIPADRSQARSAGVKISMGAGDIQEMNRARMGKGAPSFTREEMAHLSEEVGTIDELHAMSAEDFYDVVLRGIDEDIYDLIVIDSIGNLLSNAEQENESVHDKTYGGTSAPNTTFLKKMTNMLTMKTEYGEVRDTCIIGVNQVRDDIKNPNAPYRAPGGNALEHAKLVDLYIESGAPQGKEVPMLSITGDGVKVTQRFEQFGKAVNWKIVKGKAGIHEGSRGSYIHDFRTSSADFYTDSFIAAVQSGIIESAGSWFTLFGPNGETLIRTQGRDKLIEILAQDVATKQGTEQMTFMNYIRDACFKKNDITIDYDWE